MRLALVALALSACGVNEPSPTPAIKLPSDVALANETLDAISRWAAVGCSIDLSDDARPIEAIPESEWPYPTQWLGVTTPTGVYVVADLDHVRRTEILAHELGHVLGIAHLDHGIMLANPPAGVDPTATDCRSARPSARL